MARTFSKSLALGLAFASALLCVLWNGYLFAYPTEALGFLNSVSIKYLLSLTGSLLITVLGILIYVFLHIPPVKRVILSAINFCVIGGGMLCAVPFGCTRINEISVDETGLSMGTVEFTTADATSSAVLIFLIAVGGVVVLVGYFMIQDKLEFERTN